MFVLSVCIESWNYGTTFKANLDFAETIEEKRIDRHEEIQFVGLVICLILYLEIAFVYLDSVWIINSLAIKTEASINENLDHRVG